VSRNRKTGMTSLWGIALTAAVTLSFATATAQSSAPGLSNALTQLDAYVNTTMAKTNVPGASVAVVYKDQVVFLKGYGVRSLLTHRPVDPDTVFQIASFSKPIASTVVAAVVGRGEVNWDDRIKDLDPKFELSDPAVTQQVTVRDFLSHRSSLPEVAGDTLESLGATRSESTMRPPTRQTLTISATARRGSAK